MFVKFISKPIQEKLKARERALAWKTSSANAPVANGSIRPKDIMSRTTFVRMCSNKDDKVANIVISGGEIGTDGQMGFGLQQLYKASSAGIRPIAGIKNIEVIYKGSWKAIREATVNWTVSSIDDLDRLTPYFLTVGKTVVLDWGWVNPSTKSFTQQLGSAPFITKENGKFKVNQDIFSNPQELIHKKGGDYDAIGGKVSNFEYTLRPDGGFDCTTKITALGSTLFKKPLDTGANQIDFVSAEEVGKQKQGNFDGLTNAIINLRSIIVHDVFGLKYIVKEKIGATNKNKGGMPRKKMERLATFGADGKGLYDKETETVFGKKFDFPITNFEDWDTKNKNRKHTLNRTNVDGWYDGNGYSLSVDDRKNPNVLWTVTCGTGYSQHEDIFVTWAWFEDQLLNRYISFKGGDDKDIKLTFRSIDTVLDKDGLSISSDLGKDSALTDKEVEEGKEPSEANKQLDEIIEKYKININLKNPTKVFKTPTLIRNNPDFLYPINPFLFFIPEKKPMEENVSYTGTSSENLKEFIKNFQLFQPTGKIFADNNSEGKSKGRLRNIWINITEIQKAFGVENADAAEMDDVNVRPPGTLAKGIENLLNQLNANFHNFWDFEITVDPYDSTNIKVIDKSSVNLGIESLVYSKFEENSNKAQTLGIYKFPSFRIGSIVKNQNLSFKIPDSMALTALYGSNKPNRDVSNENFVNNEEMMMLFSTDKVPEGKLDFWSDKYLNNLERSYYSQNLPANGTHTAADSVRDSQDKNSKPEEKVEEVKPIIIGSEKSDHNSKISIENGIPINSKSNWWRRWTGVGVKTAPTAHEHLLREPIVKFDINEENKIVLVEEIGAYGGGVGGLGVLLKGSEQKIVLQPYEFAEISEVPKYYKYDNETKTVLLEKDVQTLIKSRLTSRQLKIDPLIPAELTLEVDGIGGVVPGDVIHTDYIQPKYNINLMADGIIYGPVVYFQVVGVSQKVDSSGWITELTTKMRMNHIPDIMNLRLGKLDPLEPFKSTPDVITTIPEILPKPPERPDVPIPSDEEDIEGDLPLEPLEVEDYEVWVPPQPLSKLELRRTHIDIDLPGYVYDPSLKPPPRPEIPTKHTFDPEEIPDVPVTELEFDDIDWTEWKLPEAVNKAQVTFSEELQEEWTEKKEQPVKEVQLTFTKYFGIMYKTFGPTTIFWWDSSWGKGASTGWKTAWKATDNKWSRRLFNKVSVNQIASAFALGAASPTPYNKESGRYPRPDLYFVIGKNYPGVDGQEYMVQDLKSISNYPSPATGTVRLSLMHIEGQYNQIVNITPVVTGD